MPFAAVATPLTMLAVALPFLYCFTQAPIINFWPVLASWGCGVVLVLFALAGRGGRSARARDPRSPWQLVSVGQLAAGLLCASLVAGVIGLLQYFLGDPGIVGVQPSTLGQAIGNLRQRNQQASLISMGVLAVFWLMEHRAPALMGSLAVAHRRMAQWGLLGICAAALALLAAASAATASRTGGLQWLLVVALLALWPVAGGRRPWGFVLLALAFYGVAAWALPVLLQAWSGVATDGLFTRFLAEQPDCNSRTALWSNVMYLIAQRPWSGWGWGELDYAHYVTLFPGERFCVLLDNAHNLPLQLAVELGLPTALLLCGLVVTWVVRSRPWRESYPPRQFAWGLLAIVGLHSLLEFPLWYGPFQLVTVLAVLLLVRWEVPSWAERLGIALVVVVVVMGGYAGWDFHRVSQLYMPIAERAPSLRSDTVRKVGGTPFFTDQVDFALLTTLGLTEDNAAQVFAVANKLLHFSPEPRVIEPLIESAVMLGLDDEAAFHLKRYRAAYPADYARWQEEGRRLSSRLRP
ncbi:pilin glycosylation ligase PglL [Acidovorax sp. 69]|uniref:Wzy polymerase domain-containing protein n=1 Tax=Acidovorax sp. 69 TaxID=2035202 RepID=UPI000C234451|nr:Wzy polymerase domain-containing protein [Acidovorax sp. 69]PJI96213.1 pilin glycosylation ligase PglL [Acidovorax sp. 69]